MDIPGLGVVQPDNQFPGWLRSEPLVVPVLGSEPRRIVVSDYFDDPRKEDFHAAIANFLSLPRSVLMDAAPFIFKYYEDCLDRWDEDDPEFVHIPSVEHVFEFVQLGTEPHVERREYGDEGIYISLECNCDWEDEHGLQIVFKNGLTVNKVSPFDGQLTNSDAYGEDEYEDVIYVELT